MRLYASLLKHATNLKYLALSDPPIVTGYKSIPDLRVESRKFARRSFDVDLDLEVLFEGIRYTRTVFLPTAIYMRAALLQKIANGRLLPYLHQLAFSSTNAQNILQFIRKRYEYSVYSMHLPTTSQNTTTTIPCPLASVNVTYIQTGNDNGDPHITFNDLCRNYIGTRIKVLDAKLKAAGKPLLTSFDSNNIRAFNIND
jgi:hypothetical protein